VSGYGMVVHSGIAIMVRGIRILSDGGMVVIEIVGVTTLHSREIGKPELLPLLEVVWPSSVDSTRIVYNAGDTL
jgi:hypothetical protein